MAKESRKFAHQTEDRFMETQKQTEDQANKTKEKIFARERYMANQKKKLNQMKAQRDFDSALQKFSDESEEVDPMRVRGSFYEMNLPKGPDEKFRKAYESKSPAKKNKKKGNYRLKPITTSK